MSEGWWTLFVIALPGGLLFAFKGQDMTKLLATGASKTPFLKIDWIDVKKSLIGLLIVLAAAALTWWEQRFASIDFGAYEAIAVAVNAFLVGLAKKAITDNTPPDNRPPASGNGSEETFKPPPY